jgi:zinc protease
MNRRLARMVAAALGLCSLASAAQAGPPPMPAVESAPATPAILAPDPAVRFGALPNGLHFAVMRNPMPAGAISVRLAFKVGSYDEADDELGYAHFIEHMAFRSTRLAPDGVLDGRFAPLGIALGKDQNAFTSLLSTIYVVDLPGDRLDGLKQILAWMRSGADGILLNPASVDAERGVVLAELASRNGPLVATQREVMRFQAAGLRFGDRDPGGSEASLKAATPSRLQAFYDRWYRPENATLVIVGDAPVETLQHLVEENFAGWTPRGEAGRRHAPPAALAARGIDALSLTNPAMPAAASSCRLAPRRDMADPAERLRRDWLSRLWSGILSGRLQHDSSVAGSPLLGGLAIVNPDLPEARATCILAMPVAGKWKEALSIGQAELRRFAKDGPTEAEMTKQIAALEAPLYGAVSLQGGRKTPALATDIANAALDNRVFQSPQAAASTMEAAMAHVTVADIRKAFEEDWSGIGPLLAVMGPEAPPKESLLAAWRENEAAAPLAAYADRETAAWAYDFGKPGKVDRRERLKGPDFLRVRFRNGVVLNFRHSDLEPGDAEIRVRFGTGASGLAPSDRGPAQFGAGLLPAGGLGKMDFEQIRSLFSQTNWKFELSIPTSAFLLTSSPLAEQTGDELQLLAAFMSDPGFRPTIDEKLPTAVDFAYRYLLTVPANVAMNALEQALFPGQGGLPPRAEIERWHARDFERLLKSALTGAPIEVTIVGDLSEKQAIAATAASFGALPKRLPATDQPSYPFRRFPEPLPPALVSYHQGPADKAAAILMWPLYVASQARRKEEYALSLVASIFQFRLIQQIRVKMGKVYAPSVSTSMPDDADQGFLAAAFEGSPGDMESLVAAAKAIARDLAAGSISQEEVDRARQPMVSTRLQAQTRNSAWAGILAEISHHPAVADELLAFPAAMAAISVDDVRAAAAAWLNREPLVSTALPTPRQGSSASQGQ